MGLIQQGQNEFESIHTLSSSSRRKDGSWRPDRFFSSVFSLSPPRKLFQLYIVANLETWYKRSFRMVYCFRLCNDSNCKQSSFTPRGACVFLKVETTGRFKRDEVFAPKAVSQPIARIRDEYQERNSRIPLSPANTSRTL